MKTNTHGIKPHFHPTIVPHFHRFAMAFSKNSAANLQNLAPFAGICPFWAHFDRMCRKEIEIFAKSVLQKSIGYAKI
ncbi:MAG: hypothetical protein J6B72_03655 [Clostridia bacterium]|nr:hypothetical protein [Clostridia bacterium]